MPDPSIMMGAGAAPPAATPPPMPPPGAIPGMPPPGGPPPGGPPPGASPQRPAGGGGNIIMLLLSFLAGAGMGDVVKNIKTLMNPGGAGRQHVGGVRMDAAKAPGMTIGPQMMQAMGGNPSAQPQAPPGMPPGAPPPGGGSPQGPGGDPKLMMLIQQLMGR